MYGLASRDFLKYYWGWFPGVGDEWREQSAFLKGLRMSDHDSKKALDYGSLALGWMQDYGVGRRLVKWRGDWLIWNEERPHHKEVDESWLTFSVSEWLIEKGLRGTRKLIGEILAAAERSKTCYLGDEVGGKTWVGAPEDRPEGIETFGKYTITFRNLSLDALSVAGGKPQTYPRTPDWFVLNSLDFDYEPEAECPEFLKFLDSSFEGDEGRIKLVRQWFAMHLVDYREFDSIVYLVGVPRSGKTTLTRIYSEVMGTENVASTSIESLGSNRFALWELRHKPAILIPDAYNSVHCNKVVGSLLKCISGREPVRIDIKGRKAVSEQLGQIVISANEFIQFRDESGALASRIKLIPFEKSFAGVEDRDLLAKLEREKAGILNWALEIVLETVQQGKYVLPEKSLEYHERYESSLAPLTEFFEDYTEQKPQNSRSACLDVYWVYEKVFCPARRQVPLEYQSFLSKAMEKLVGVKVSRSLTHQDYGFGGGNRPIKPLCFWGMILKPEIVKKIRVGALGGRLFEPGLGGECEE